MRIIPELHALDNHCGAVRYSIFPKRELRLLAVNPPRIFEVSRLNDNPDVVVGLFIVRI